MNSTNATERKTERDKENESPDNSAKRGQCENRISHEVLIKLAHLSLMWCVCFYTRIETKKKAKKTLKHWRNDLLLINFTIQTGFPIFQYFRLGKTSTTQVQCCAQNRHISALALAIRCCQNLSIYWFVEKYISQECSKCAQNNRINEYLISECCR